MSPMRRIGKAATALATRAALLAEEGVRMASAGDSGALAACLGNSSLMVFHSTVLMQIGASAHHSTTEATLLPCKRHVRSTATVGKKNTWRRGPS